MYLGIRSSPTYLDDEDCMVISKVGGKLPKDFVKLQQKPIKCISCESPLWLIAQIHSPIDLEDDEELRTLFVLSCNEKSCKKPTWKAYRYQKPKRTNTKDNSNKKKNESNTITLNNNNKNNTGNDTSNEKSNTSALLWAKFTSESMTQNNMSNVEALLKLRDEANKNTNVKSKKPKKTSSKPLNSLLFTTPDLSKDKKSVTSERNDNSDDSSLDIKKDTVLVSENEIHSNQFDSYYIEFEDEPEEIKYDDILKKYSKEIKECNSNIGEWEGEKYESNCKDKIFYKFQKRIERNQSQCIRYSRRGEPLWIRKETPTSIPECEVCGSKRTFEMQLMPSLIYMLQSPQGVHLDYGTITVYTCSNDNCYKETLNEEYVFVQASV